MAGMRLYICEKPSQGRDIARNVGAGQKRNGYMEGDGVAVTWGFGHLLEQANPEKYNPDLKQWALATLPILPDNWIMEVKKESRDQFKVIQTLIKQASQIVIATDADREGESIGREMLDYCNYKGPVERLWLSALDDVSIKKALAKVLPGEKTESLYQAALGRSRADWTVGMNLTRACTVGIGQRAGLGTLTVGRVQTPTLAMVVMRDLEIENFRPKDFYDVEGIFRVAAGELTAKWVVPESAAGDEDGRCLDKDIAQKVVNDVSGNTGKVTKADTTGKSEKQPLPMDLSTLQQLANKRWGYGAEEVLKIAQALYETHKATTYPRTDCRFLPEEQMNEIKDVMKGIVKTDPTLEPFISKADLSMKSHAWNTSKITAHHGIIPTTTASNLASMSEKERNVYDVIARHFIAQFYPLYQYDQTVIEVKVADHLFRASGRVPTKMGWHEVIKSGGGNKGNEDDQLVKAVLGEAAPCTKANLKLGKTTPPKRFTEGTLIAAMKNIGKDSKDPEVRKVLRENSGIGTEATRAATIEGLIRKGSLLKVKRDIVSSDTARSLIKVLPEELTSPVMTARWEQALEMIVQGTLTLEKFMAAQQKWVTSMVDRIKNGDITVKIDTRNQHVCPECGSVMNRRKGKDGFFWGCGGYPACKVTLPDEKGKPGKPRPPAAKPVETDIDCPKCKKHKLVERKTKDGRTFLSCAGYPACDHSQWPEDTSAELCDKCGKGRMIERTIKKGDNKGKKFHSCSAYPACENTKWPEK